MLLCLPTELIVEVFDKADSFTTAFALSHTCHRLRTIWKANANAILPSVVECFPQALELTHTQDMFGSDKNGRIQKLTYSRQEIPILYPERIERNANFVSHILPYYEHNIINALALRGIKRDALLTDDRMDLLRAIYRAMTLTAAGKEGCASHSLLPPLDIREYKQVRESMDFLQSWFKADQTQWLELCNPINMKDLHLNRGNAFRALPYMQVSDKLALLQSELTWLPPDDIYFKRFRKHFRLAPWGYHTMLDGDPKGAGSGRGVFMGDLLQRLERHRRTRGGHM